MSEYSNTYMEKSSRILITGASGLIGSALVPLLRTEGYENLLIPSHEELDLRQQPNVFRYFEVNDPDYVFHLAARVGGIKDNYEYPAEFCHDNTVMHCNVFLAANACQVYKILFPGSACAYPVLDRPIKESDFLQGPPEPTNLAYAAAKINGVVMAQSFAKQYGMKVVLPMVANAYGPSDGSSHVIPNLIDKFIDAQRNNLSEVILWGTGYPMREFIYEEDIASALLFLMENYNSPKIINVGTMEEISIAALALAIAEIVGYKGEIKFDKNMPDGTMRKCLDSSQIRSMGWMPETDLVGGLRQQILIYQSQP